MEQRINGEDAHVPDIRHRVGIKAPPPRVFEAVATAAGLAGWWTQTLDGDESVGGLLRFYFGGPSPSAVMEIVDLVADSRVGWRCREGPDDWIDTTVTFAFSSSD